ncbi:MAG: DNA alkylation repair protein [Nanoarchaeota archaeon]|nr:DNA alkylation repair protein [Nanoarchaeota archaeon]
MIEELREDLERASNPEGAKASARFFKTGSGDYGEGDVFAGISMPRLREIAKKYTKIPLNEITELMNSKFHEYRMIGLILLVEMYKKSGKDYSDRRKIFEFYLKSMPGINNWDLVDVSAPHIPGDFAYREKSDVLRNLALSNNLWCRRIAIVSTYRFIKEKDFGEALVISDILMKDEHDLMHKAVGWMLREIGKRNQKILELFLSTRYKDMPRTMLRYAIEKFEKDKRRKYLKGEI